MRSSEANRIRFVLRTVGVLALGVGLAAIAFGSLWASDTLELFSHGPIGPVLELFVPFLPIFLTAFGAFLLIQSRE